MERETPKDPKIQLEIQLTLLTPFLLKSRDGGHLPAARLIRRMLECFIAGISGKEGR